MLLLSGALVGCVTKPALQSSVEYRIPLTNGYVAHVQMERDTFRVIVRHGDDAVTDLMTDGRNVQFTQSLDSRANRTQRKNDVGLGSVFWMATRDGKLTRHYVESFDGKTQRRFYDRDNDFFFDERASVDVDEKFELKADTKRRETITHQFVPKEVKDSK